MVSFSVVKEVIPGHVGSLCYKTPERLFHLSMTETLFKDVSDSRRLSRSADVCTTAAFGGDKTDTPTDMLHKEAQVAFKILMTH